MGRALITDLYELNMAASYLRRGMVGSATFSLFVRKLPADRGFLVAAGLEDCLSHLESFSFEDEDLAWLREAGFSPDTVDAFAGLRFTGDVFAVPEGRVVLTDEPILEVTAPIPEAQLVETYLLNQVTFQTALATKATRCRLAAGDIELVDFALRRTHGIEAGMAVARLSAIAGFGSTSNVDAARRFGLRAAGTMAHSYIEAFPTEVEAFRAFAQDLPERTTFLVDTYDTLTGVATAIEVIRELGLSGSLGVRLDSGDLVALARDARRMLDEAGLPQVRIFASGGLDEYDLERFVAEGAPIDAVGRRHPNGRLGRRPVTRQRLQARRVRQPAGAEAVGRQRHPARRQAGVAPINDRGGSPRPARRARAGWLGALAGAGDARGGACCPAG